MEITKKLKEIILSDNTGFIMGTHNGILMKIVKESRLKKSIKWLFLNLMELQGNYLMPISFTILDEKTRSKLRKK